MVVWKVAPTLATGCTTVLKPSELASVTCLELRQICRDVGLPLGVLNILMGLGPAAGAPLSSHPHVDKIACTGSTMTRSKIMPTTAQLIKPISLELGGKNLIVVFEDVDLDKAVEWTLFGCFWTNDQICVATIGLITHDNIAEQFLNRLEKWIKNIKISDTLEEGCRLGPVVSKGQYEKVLKFTSTGKSEGATILTGGSRPRHLNKGFFIEPTIVTDVTTSMQIWGGEWGLENYLSVKQVTQCISCFVTYLETLAIFNFPCYQFVDRGVMYKVGSLFYVI
ncbi:hypothetical protein K1719_019021 [Acacia pycnantha]|nr:hypothetical protein K1719_019021 [Acacia pycnantha]